MKRVVYSLTVIALVIALSVGMTGAYFTGQDKGRDSVFSTGTLEVHVDQPIQPSQSNFLPGSVAGISFAITNSDSVPILVKGYFDGSWDDELLDTEVIRITNFEMQIDGVGEQVGDGDFEVGEEFVITDPQGTSYTFASNQSINFRGVYEFDSAAGDEYQGKQLTIALHVAAKQVDPEGEWPAEY